LINFRIYLLIHDPRTEVAGYFMSTLYRDHRHVNSFISTYVACRKKKCDICDL